MEVPFQRCKGVGVVRYARVWVCLWGPTLLWGLALLTRVSLRYIHQTSPVLLMLMLALSDCPSVTYAGWTAGLLASWHLKRIGSQRGYFG